MKAIYKDIIKFTAKYEDLFRNPIANDKLVDIFCAEYNLTTKEANIFFLIFTTIIKREEAIQASTIKEILKLTFDEYIELVNIIDSLRAKGMIVYGEKDINTIGVNFNPYMGIDDSLTNKLIFGKDPLSECDLSNIYSILNYTNMLFKQRKNGELSTTKLHVEIDTVLSKADKSLSQIHNIRSYNKNERAILLFVAGEYLSGNNIMTMAHDIAETIEENPTARMPLFTKISNKNLKLFKDNYIELEDGVFVDNPVVRLSAKGANKLFNLNINQKNIDKRLNLKMCHYIKHKGLRENLVFSKDFENDIFRLQKALKPKNFKQLSKNLKINNYSKGFVCLFYGEPGTGKTASVYEIAKLTKRDILQVDIEKIRDKFVGESEKNLRLIFEEYKEAKEVLNQTPILLFNEADALISTRMNINGSVDQMNNSMQNILLQNLEDFDGICIATTNLIENIDKAFSRRFLYKLKFPKPSAEIRMRIWQKKLPKQNKKIYKTISQYDLSGGQIELIAKQFVIQSFMEKIQDPLDTLESMIKKELSYKTEGVKSMGFLS